MSTLFEKIGGADAVNAAVEKFYEKVLADDRIKHFFEGVDMDRQAKHQKRFFTYAFGGAPSYPGKAMRVAHKRLVEEMGLSDEHFDAVLENLGETLKELGVPDDLIGEAASIAESTRNDVLNRNA
jgi:hemoglobin